MWWTYGSVGVVGRAHVGVHVPNALPVALRHRDDAGSDVEGLTATLLLRSTAALANRERDLVARAARILRTLEGLTAEEQDGRVVIERLARVATDFRHRFAKGREDSARKLEAEHVTLEVGVRNVVGKASRTMAGNEVFDFTYRPPSGGFEPIPLGGRRRDASELAREREADGPGL